MPNQMNTSASAVSAKLNKLGYKPIGSEDARRRHTDGVRVERPIVRGMDVMVSIHNFGGTWDMDASIAKLTADLNSVGLTVTDARHDSDELATLYVAKAQPVVTASGHAASPVEGEPQKWLVRMSAHTYWVIELHARDTDITKIDLNDCSPFTPWGISATARRILARDGATHPGWYTEISGNTVGPMRTRDEALDSLLTQIADNRSARAARNGV